MEKLENGIRLISVNIEKHKHIDKIIALLEKIQPDVVCFQEIFESDFSMFKKRFNMDGEFAPAAKNLIDKDDPHSLENEGVGMMSRPELQFTNSKKIYYFGSSENIPLQIYRDHMTTNRVFLFGTFTRDKKEFIIGTTHLIVTDGGEAADFQRKDLENFLAIVKKIPELVFCGDFNAPRGREIFDKIASLYKDNIPVKYKTSIDGNIHRAGHMPFMVDGIFSTPHYQVKNVQLIDSVSDHMAIVAEVYKI